MNDGWIKIYRQLLTWEWFDNSKMVHIFLYFLLRANTEDKEWRGLTIRRGQFATAVPTISAATGLSEQEIRTCVKRLVKAEQIEYNSTHRATHRCVVITICNYEKYQVGNLEDNGQTNEPPTDKQRTSNEPPTDKQREYKNNKNKRIKEDIIPPSLRSGGSSDLQSNPEAWRLNEEKFIEFFNSEMDAHGAIIPRIKSLGETRRTHVEARCREHGKEALAQMVRKAAQSNFLNGHNKRGWKATFDWLILPTNFPKVIEGTYDNDINQITKNYGTTTSPEQHIDPNAARQRQFAEHIITKLNAPDNPEADVTGLY